MHALLSLCQGSLHWQAHLHGLGANAQEGLVAGREPCPLQALGKHTNCWLAYTPSNLCAGGQMRPRRLARWRSQMRLVRNGRTTAGKRPARHSKTCPV